MVTVSDDKAHRDAKASPRNPKVCSEAISAYEDSFDVWCLRAIEGWLAGEMPEPLSWTSIESRPWFLKRTSGVDEHGWSA